MTSLFEIPGKERTFDASEIIVSKTDKTGIITYANDLFLDIADYSEQEILGKPHSIIRHDFMPRCIYKLMWSHLLNGKEIFAYVINRTKHNDYYWVLAHVTPTLDQDQNISGFHSNRRVPNPEAIKIIASLYQRLKQIEEAQSDRKKGLEISYDILLKLMREQQMRYDMFIYKLQQMQQGDPFGPRFAENTHV